MAFFAEDVHLLASVSVEGRLFLWKISEGPDEEGTPQITGKIVIAIQIVGEEEAVRPRVCWHCHKQEVLAVGVGKRVLRIDATKVAKGEVPSAEDPIKCPVEKLMDGVQFVGKHDGEVTDLSMCQWMTTWLVSASMDGTGPLNREVKIWSTVSEEGWLLPSDVESWKSTQTLELKSDGVGEGKKNHLVRWEIVSKSKERGGLGIGNLLAKNMSFLGKWLWRFPLERESLWHAVIRSKYGYDVNGWDTKPSLGGSSRSPWKDISAGISQYSLCHKLIVGNGKRVRFWEDSWLEDQPLKFYFPRLFRLSRHTNYSVERLAIPLNFPMCWDFGFRRNLNDQEIEEFASLMVKLENVRLVESKLDERRWKLEPNGKFSCKSFHSFLISGGSDPIFPPAKFIWKVKVPTKVKILGWLVVLGKTNTCDVLQRRRPGICFSPHWCILCKAQGESADHVFVHCEVANFLWKKLFWEARVDWTTSLERNDLLRENPIAFGNGKKARTLWGCGVLAVVWVVWMERNKRLFENYGGVEKEDLWERVKFWASLWVSISKEFKDYNLSSIILNWQAAVV